MYRVLVFGMTENPGGVESFLVNYYRHIDRNKLQFDFLCNSHNPIAYEEDIKELGARCFHITARSVNYHLYKKEMNNIFRIYAKEWDAIWVNICSLANIDYLKMAKKYGIKKRIIHSHNSQNMDGVLRGFLHKWNKCFLHRYATDYWACSSDAALWFYDKTNLKRAVIIHNAIDVEKMKFDAKKRIALRNLYGWNEKIVIGNIGRLHFQKNQTFLIEIFEQYHRKNSDSILVLVGAGEDEQMLKNKVEELKLSQEVYFVGVQKDIQAWLSCFDLFLFPSKFEGLSIAALEAQANGVPVLASQKVIPEAVKMNDNFKFLELDESQFVWSDNIDQLLRYGRENMNLVKDNFKLKGFEINTESKKLETLFLN